MGTQAVTHRSQSLADTERIAADLAATLRGGECIVLTGPLGAGKTQFVRGLVAALGGPARRACSPTFMLLNIYPGGRLTVYHLDAYRVAGPDDFQAIGFAELLEQGGVVAVEWGEKVRSLLPADHIQITIDLPQRLEDAAAGARVIHLQRDEPHPRPQP
jgi:tRNA threonylcarbamoyladenosine biosynthesis protein TsaE